ncbi:GGDEF domain-containing protein [Paenibacillus endophyticus]|uniref:GGDEF domain-containing protein n=1 Tax=Paenibacillus endophyticus TaxID=1294268 RepID=A0A7W5C3L2_9BACL|nr:GGDEF domain-containing protein [Paenibacillus endophyticus]MBB3150029.1 GGDEF domain-containing protein [Paenibacillus endophyticus]
MKRNQSSLMSDIAFLLLFLVCLISMMFTAGNSDQYILNIILLNVAFLIAIVTYFTTVTTGLILNIVFIFGYGTFTLYQTVAVGDVVSVQHYFWLIMTPIITAVTWMLTAANKQLQAEKDLLVKQNVSLATMDERTNLKNSRSFQKDATVFMALSTRYQIPLTLLVVTVKYWDELSRMISQDQMTEMIYDVSKLNETSIRLNDSLYMLNTETPTWGMLLFTDDDGANIVIKRLREKTESFNSVEFAGKYRVELKLTMSAVQYHPESIATPLDFIVQARKRLEYDV